MSARVAATTFLTPRWAGTFELLDQMVLRAKKSLPAENTHYLGFLVTLAKASHEENIVKNRSGAHTLYKRAKEMCMNAVEAQQGVNRTYQRTDANGQIAR